MSAIVIIRLRVDPANLEQLWQERAADFEAIVAVAKAAGATHHQWAFGDGQVVILDEWSDAASFQQFFASETRVAELMAAGGVQGPPEIEILELRAGPDSF